MNVLKLTANDINNISKEQCQNTLKAVFHESSLRESWLLEFTRCKNEIDRDEDANELAEKFSIDCFYGLALTTKAQLGIDKAFVLSCIKEGLSKKQEQVKEEIDKLKSITDLLYMRISDIIRSSMETSLGGDAENFSTLDNATDIVTN